jgi:hypothetical protein
MSDDTDLYRYQPYLSKFAAGLVTIILLLQVAAIKEWVGITKGEQVIIILIVGYAAIFGVVWFGEGISGIGCVLISALSKYEWFRTFSASINKRLTK